MALNSPRGTLLRVDPRTVVIFATMLSPALLVAGQLVWHERQLPEAAVLFLLYALGVYWMCGRSVEIAPGRIVYRVFFVRKVIDVSDITAATIVARPAPTLELRHEGSSHAVPAFIVKPFTKTGVAAILQHIRESSPGVKFNSIAVDMGAGRFDTIARETTKAVNLLRLVLLVAGMLVLGSLARMFLR